MKNTILRPIGDHVSFWLVFKKSEKRSISHNAQETSTDES